MVSILRKNEVTIMKNKKLFSVFLAVLVLLPCLGLTGCGKTYEVELMFGYPAEDFAGMEYSKRIDVKKGDTLPAKELRPTRKGYTFKGWFRDPSYTSVWLSTDKVTCNVMLYAKWEPA